jgi:YhcN/YlaJ family sporulation lipoprotein
MRIMLLLLISLVWLSGCTARPQNEASPPTNDQEHQIRVKQTIPRKQEIMNNQEVSTRLENIAEGIPQVKSANCVVFGNTAVVGINVEGNLDRSKVGTVKYAVAEALQKDPYGVHSIVTADMDLAERLRKISSEVRQGRPVAGFAEEMGAIIGRIVPQLPRDVLPDNEEPLKSEDSHKLNKEHL